MRTNVLLAWIRWAVTTAALVAVVAGYAGGWRSPVLWGCAVIASVVSLAAVCSVDPDLRMLFVMPSSALAIGSWWALAVALYTLLLCRRVVLEDRFLEQNLAGHKDYAKDVPFRLVPGLW